jgi:fatty acid desaturase
VAPRTRALAFGAAAVLVAAGAACAVAVHGLTGEVLTLALMLAGLGAVVLLLFLEVGLSEDHARAEDERRRRSSRRPARRLTLRRPPRRPG